MCPSVSQHGEISPVAEFLYERKVARFFAPTLRHFQVDVVALLFRRRLAVLRFLFFGQRKIRWLTSALFVLACHAFSDLFDVADVPLGRSVLQSTDELHCASAVRRKDGQVKLADHRLPNGRVCQPIT